MTTWIVVTKFCAKICRFKISVESVNEQHFLNSCEIAILLDRSFQRSNLLISCGTFTLVKEEEENCFMKVFYSYPIMQGNSVLPNNRLNLALMSTKKIT